MTLYTANGHVFGTNAKQVVAFAGLAPYLRESGPWSGKTRIAKSGDPILRKALYNVCSRTLKPDVIDACKTGGVHIRIRRQAIRHYFLTWWRFASLNRPTSWITLSTNVFPFKGTVFA